MSKGKAIKQVGTSEPVKKPVPNGVNGYRSMSDKAIQKTCNQTMGIALTAMFTSILIFILTIINTFILAGLADTGITTKTFDDWVECTLENYVGYKVKKDWTAISVESGVAFKISESEAISIDSRAVADINKTQSINLTYETIDKLVESDLSALNNQDEITISNITKDTCEYIGQSGMQYNFKQETKNPDDGTTATTYTKSIFFIYKDYLYSFAYVSAASYSSKDFQSVLDSIRVIPEEERQEVVPVEDLDSEWVNLYSDFGNTMTLPPEAEESTSTSGTSIETSDTTVPASTTENTSDTVQ